MQQTIVNPFYAARINRTARQPQDEPYQPVYAKLPRAPRNASPVPHLTSLYHFSRAGEYGDRKYPGNCGGNLIKDLLRFFKPFSVFDPMTGSGTCRDVCEELGIYCWSSDLHEGTDACDAKRVPPTCFDFCWIHPPYWRQKLYTDDPRDLSRAPTLAAFLDRYKLLLANCAGALAHCGKLAVLMGDYSDRQAGFVPLVYHTKRLAFECGLKQHGTDIIRFSHGASSSTKVYRSSFIPGLHDVCIIFRNNLNLNRERNLTMKRPDPTLDGIAREHLLIPTLECRHADSLDFHNVAVWQVETALKAAFDAGVRSAEKNVEPQGARAEQPVPDALATPLLIPKGTRLLPGRMFLRLYHGRTDPAQEMDEWGFVGPTFGPLSCYVHTYCCNFRIYGENDTSEVWLDKHDDMIQWDGCFYGDMEVFIAGTDDKA